MMCFQSYAHITTGSTNNEDVGLERRINERNLSSITTLIMTRLELFVNKCEVFCEKNRPRLRERFYLISELYLLSKSTKVGHTSSVFGISDCYISSNTSNTDVCYPNVAIRINPTIIIKFHVFAISCHNLCI